VEADLLFMEIKNIAIIAHVDHGKTTMVDAMLKQTHTFRENQKEMGETLIMDSNDLEREKGITILSKNTSVFYKEYKINIIDTPGHADFGGEVERVLNMASGAILLVDAAEGPLPQTKFVLKKALEAKLKIILVINKIDRKDARPKEIITDVENLFLELAHDDASLHFTTLYAVGRDGKAFYELPERYSSQTPGDLGVLFDTVIKEIPNSAVNQDQPFQMLISTLDYDNYVGKICIGKVNAGTLKKGDAMVLVDENKIIGNYRAQKLYTSEGLKRIEVETVTAGDIVAIAGIPELTIGQTITHPATPVSLPKIAIEEPTIKITIGPNTSPLSGREGKLFSSAQIKDRLMRERETNLGLKIEQDADSSNFSVAGRGELHLSVLLETMRREGFELEVSKPQVIYKEIDGVVCEPFEEVTLDVATEFVGIITEEMAKRKGEMIDMEGLINNSTRFVYKVSSQNLLGIRNILLTKTKGTAVINTYFLGYFPKIVKMDQIRNGALVAIASGISLAYGLENAQDRGVLFVGPGEQIYEGMIVGLSSREFDIEVNVCKGKHLTNVRSNGEVGIQLTPPIILNLEQSLDFINDDELLEITPETLRLRKKYLSTTRRRVMERRD
jgi:GTP-binding protein